MKKSELRKFIREAIKSVLKELDGGPPLVASDGTIQGGPKKKDDEEESVEEKVVFYKDDKDRLRRFDTDKSANKKYRT
jgi:hypothetical protein